MNGGCDHLCLHREDAWKFMDTSEKEEKEWHTCRIGQDMLFCGSGCAFATNRPASVRTRKEGNMGNKFIHVEPCPFCGSEAAAGTFDRKTWYVMCLKCKAESAGFDNVYDAVAAWNKRTGGSNGNVNGERKSERGA